MALSYSPRSKAARMRLQSAPGMANSDTRYLFPRRYSLKPKLKKHVVETFLSGSSKIEPYETKAGQKQSEEEYVMMRKFGLILLQDIMDDRDSLVRREFASYMPPGGEEIIRQKFEGQKDFIDIVMLLKFIEDAMILFINLYTAQMIGDTLLQVIHEIIPTFSLVHLVEEQNQSTKVFTTLA